MKEVNLLKTIYVPVNGNNSGEKKAACRVLGNEHAFVRAQGNKVANLGSQCSVMFMKRETEKVVELAAWSWEADS